MSGLRVSLSKTQVDSLAQELDTNKSTNAKDAVRDLGKTNQNLDQIRDAMREGSDNEAETKVVTGHEYGSHINKQMLGVETDYGIPPGLQRKVVKGASASIRSPNKTLRGLHRSLSPPESNDGLGCEKLSEGISNIGSHISDVGDVLKKKEDELIQERARLLWGTGDMLLDSDNEIPSEEDSEVQSTQDLSSNENQTTSNAVNARIRVERELVLDDAESTDGGLEETKSFLQCSNMINEGVLASGSGLEGSLDGTQSDELLTASPSKRNEIIWLKKI